MNRPDRVELWHAAASTDQPGEMERRCEAWLCEHERIEANRFKRPTTRNQHVIGRGMTRRLLAGDAMATTDVCFRWLDHGKPVVAGPPAAVVPFNVAHTDGLVVCGLTRRRDLLIGVDVERLHRRTDPSLAVRYFAPAEIDHLNRCGDDRSRQETFLKIWTLKESFIKAIGTGLYTPLGDFAFEAIDSQRPRLRVHRDGLDQDLHWTFRCFTPRPGFLAAVAIADPTGRDDYDIRLHPFETWPAEIP